MSWADNDDTSAHTSRRLRGSSPVVGSSRNSTPGRVHQCTGDVDAAAHASRIGVHRPVGGVLHVELFDQFVGATPRSVAAHAAQPAEQHEVLPAGEHEVERGFLPGEADAGAYLARLVRHVVSRDHRLAGGRPQAAWTGF